MNKFYRVILSIAGVCLIFGIIICIIAGVSGGWNFVRNGFDNNWHWDWDNDNKSHSHSNYEYEDVNKTFKNDDIKSLDFTIPYGDVTIEKGSEFSLVATDVVKNSFTKAEVDNGVLKIEQEYDEDILNTGIHFSAIYGDNCPKITITIPEGFKADEFILDFGADKIDISDVNTEYTSLELGAGEFSVNNLTANKIDIDGGVGQVKMENVNLNDLDIDAGIGEFNIQGIVTGDCKISGGVGRVVFDIDGDEDDYYITLDTGIGDIRLNNDKISSSVGDHSAKNSLDIDAGIGQIKINVE